MDETKERQEKFANRLANALWGQAFGYELCSGDVVGWLGSEHRRTLEEARDAVCPDGCGKQAPLSGNCHFSGVYCHATPIRKKLEALA